MPDSLFVLALSIFVIIVLYNSMRIAGESERFAVFTLGRFKAFKGPGLVVVIPSVERVHRLKIGDVGVLTTSEFARFSKVDIPVTDVGSLRQGQAIRIDGFDGGGPRVVASAVPTKSICPNCGHNF